MNERGSAVVESIFSMVVLMVLVLGVTEVAFTLYARNVVMASAHEGARAAAEYRSAPEEAQALATETVRRSAAGLVSDLKVSLSSITRGGIEYITVTVSGHAEPIGPVPFPVTLTGTSTTSREIDIP